MMHSLFREEELVASSSEPMILRGGGWLGKGVIPQAEPLPKQKRLRLEEISQRWEVLDHATNRKARSRCLAVKVRIEEVTGMEWGRASKVRQDGSTALVRQSFSADEVHFDGQDHLFQRLPGLDGLRSSSHSLSTHCVCGDVCYVLYPKWSAQLLLEMIMPILKVLKRAQKI